MQYKIYQLSHTGKFTYHFMPWEFAKRYNFSIADYTLVYSGDNICYKNGVECRNTETALEILFTKFNIRRPSDFTGHSLSMSDIVEITENNRSEFYYCDSFGWKNITEEVLMREVIV